MPRSFTPLNSLRAEFARLRASAPGQRFQDRWRRQHGARFFTRLAYASLGLVLITFGILMMFLPGPGMLIALLGIAYMGTIWRPGALLLDHIEMFGIRAWHLLPERSRQGTALRVLAVGFVISGLVVAGLSAVLVSRMLFA